MHDVIISPEAEDALDQLYQRWQRKWTNAKTDNANLQSVAALNALGEVYAILGLETP